MPPGPTPTFTVATKPSWAAAANGRKAKERANRASRMNGVV